jgi:quercetin dioxygenase-like cupin family protein
MPAIKWSDVKEELIDPEFSPAKGPVVRGREIEVGCIVYPEGSEAKVHALPNEQIQTVMKGKVRGLAGENVVSGPGDVILIPALIQHWASIIEDCETVNCKNIVPGWSVYNARWEK